MKYFVMPTVFILLNIAYFILLSAAIFGSGHWIGTKNERVKTGSPAYFVIDNIRGRLKSEKADVIIKDLELLLSKMDDKNNSGVNGPMMIEYLEKFQK